MYYDRLIDKEDDNVVRHVRICPLIPLTSPYRYQARLDLHVRS